MNTAPRWCRPHDSLASAVHLMNECRLSWVPIVAHGKRVVGVLTMRDISVAAQTRRLRLDEIAVEGAMHTDVHACHPGDELDNVLVAMENYCVRRMPVVDADGALVGCVSLSDVARRTASDRPPAISAEQVVRVLSAIEEPRSAREKA